MVFLDEFDEAVGEFDEFLLGLGVEGRYSVYGFVLLSYGFEASTVRFPDRMGASLAHRHKHTYRI